MLDIELVEGPEDTGLDIVSLAEFKKHMRRSQSGFDDEFTAAIKEAADKLHGRDGELNRSVFPVTWCRYLRAFPKGRIIRLPYPPLIEVSSIVYEDPDGASPTPLLESSKYIQRTQTLIGEIELLPDYTWPSVADHPRAIAITYRAGYETYPDKLKRLVKILAGHYVESKEAAITERAQSMMSRKVEFGVEDLRAALRVPVAYDDWED